MHLDEFHATVASLTRELALVSVSGELDLYTAERVRNGIDEADAVGADTVVIDLSDELQAAIVVTHEGRLLT